METKQMRSINIMELYLGKRYAIPYDDEILSKVTWYEVNQ